MNNRKKGLSFGSCDPSSLIPPLFRLSLLIRTKCDPGFALLLLLCSSYSSFSSCGCPSGIYPKEWHASQRKRKLLPRGNAQTGIYVEDAVSWPHRPSSLSQRIACPHNNTGLNRTVCFCYSSPLIHSFCRYFLGIIWMQKKKKKEEDLEIIMEMKRFQ